MSIENAQLLIEKDGKMTPPNRYIYIQAEGDEYEILIEAGLGDLLNGVFLLWAAIKDEAKDLSDQELYELSGDFNIDYDIFRKQVRNA